MKDRDNTTLNPLGFTTSIWGNYCGYVARLTGDVRNQHKHNQTCAKNRKKRKKKNRK